MYSVGLLVFAICSAICAGIDNVIGLYVVRAIQGIAAACTIPTSYALVATTFTGKSQQMAVSGLGACQATGAVIGTLGTTCLTYLCNSLEHEKLTISQSVVPSPPPL